MTDSEMVDEFDDGDLIHYRYAPSGKGELAYVWEDKPHRLVYDLINKVKEERAKVASLLAPPS